MPKKHYSEKDFIITQTHNDNDYGYCNKCGCDMQRLSDKILRHYKTHQYKKQNAVITALNNLYLNH